MNRFALYALLENFNPEAMNPREYLVRRHGITDPKMQDVWLQGSEARPPRNRPVQEQYWHHLLSAARDLCRDIALVDLVAFFDTLARDFLITWRESLWHVSSQIPASALHRLSRLIIDATILRDLAPEAIDTEEGREPMRDIPRWRGSEDLPRDLNRDIAHPSSFRKVTLRRSDACNEIVSAVEAKDHIKIILALISIVDQIYNQREEVDFTRDFRWSIGRLREGLLELHKLFASQR